MAAGYKIAAFISILSVLFFSMISFIVFASLGVYATAFGILSPIGIKESLTIFSRQSGMASAVQGSLLLGATAFGSIIATLIMKVMPKISVLHIFSYSSIVIAAGTALAAVFASGKLLSRGV